MVRRMLPIPSGAAAGAVLTDLAVLVWLLRILPSERMAVALVVGSRACVVGADANGSVGASTGLLLELDDAGGSTLRQAMELLSSRGEALLM
jgi:hypothetical protein